MTSLNYKISHNKFNSFKKEKLNGTTDLINNNSNDGR